ncbi:MAG: HupE/UreJ family protein [Granulosicoccaceae bacterium]
MTTVKRHSVLTPFTSLLALATILLALPFQAFAHGVAEGDQSFISTGSGRMVFAYLYLGAKHMVTGYDHLLFLLGVIFFLYKMRDVGLYVTLFAVGHSVTMLLGVLADIQVNAYFIDAIIGFSVIYKAADNLGLWNNWFGWSPDTRAATLVFGLLHGFGLATKIQEFGIPENGLIANLISFNIGVEIGQLLALGAILILMGFWRRSESFWQQARMANIALMACGFALMAYQINGLMQSV